MPSIRHSQEHIGVSKHNQEDIYVQNHHSGNTLLSSKYSGKLYKGNVLSKRKEDKDVYKLSEIMVILLNFLSIYNILNKENTGREKQYYPETKIRNSEIERY